jgi:hypothetical protein
VTPWFNFLKGNVNVKVKTILYIIGAVIVIAFASVSGLIALFPLAIGIVLLVNIKQNDFAKYVGFLSLKSVFIFFLIFFVNSDVAEKIAALYSYKVVLASLWFIPELILTLFIFFVFRRLIRDDRTALVFLFGDVIRWLSLSTEALIPDPFPEPYFYTQLYVFAFFAVFYPSLYAISGLIIVMRRANTQKTVSLSSSLSE